MILFRDSSSQVKLHVAQEGSDLLKQRLRQTGAIVACRIAWAEAHAV